MTRTERNLLAQTSALGVLLTLVVVVLVWTGQLNALERWFYDRRARIFQYYLKPPTDKLVHLDIDDKTLAAVGPWPWKRTILADIIDELHVANPKVIALDAIFPEPQDIESRPTPDGGWELVDHDANFAAAVERFGPVLLPFYSTFKAPDSNPTRERVQRSAVEALKADAEVPDESALRETLISQFKIAPADAERYLPTDTFIAARREAMFQRVLSLLQAAGGKWPSITIEQVQSTLLPRTDPAITSSPTIRTLKEQFRRAQSVLMLRRFATTVPPNISAMLPINVLPPIPPLSRAAGASGFVDNVADSDGVVRSIALWENADGWVYPQLGLSLACKMLGVDVKKIIIHEDEVIIPKPDGGQVVLPVRSQPIAKLNGNRVGMYFDIPWWGMHEEWETMYDVPAYQKMSQHLSLARVWDASEQQHHLRENLRNIDDAVRAVFAQTEPLKIDELDAHPLAADDVEGRAKVIAEALKQAESVVDTIAAMTPTDIAEQAKYMAENLRKDKQQLIDQIGAMSPADRAAFLKAKSHVERADIDRLLSGGLDNQVRQYELSQQHLFEKFVPSVKTLPHLLDGSRELAKNLAGSRAFLRASLAGKAVLLGWTATAAAADFVPTPLVSKCPGPIIHGVIFNAIMTGEIWKTEPVWVTLLTTLMIGLAATAVVALLTPGRAFVAAIALSAGYALVNCLLLFDYGNLIVGLAGPVVTVGAVWSACTLLRYYVERRERKRIEGRFRGYVDPALVDYVIENPDLARLEGEEREMSVVFTDLAGFTTISEKLREKTVPLLNRYLSVMVPLIGEQNGFVNKFLGDGIMFFYGVPKINHDHAANALATVLRMQTTMIDFNAGLAKEGLPSIGLRAGIATGPMIVGDAGGTGRSDYTVIGDTVNLSARLESANKATGTKILVTDRTIELAGGAVLARPVARLTVKGKSVGVLVFEPLALMKEATDEHRKLVEMTKAIVEPFYARNFAKCIEAVEAYEKAYGDGKFTHLYRHQAEAYLKEPPPDSWDCSIVLTEK